MRSTAATSLILVSALVAAPAGFGQQDQVESSRKIVNRVAPAYPQLARSINLTGIVKVEAVVEPNGVVKSINVKGGNAVLVRAAENAIYKWKWAPASHETREPVEVKFDPN